MSRILYPFGLALVLAAYPAVAKEVDSSPQNVPDNKHGKSVLQEQQRSSNCLQYTGSRIVSNRSARTQKNNSTRRDECAPMPGRSYSRDDIDSTGAVDLGEALRRLDPAIR